MILLLAHLLNDQFRVAITTPYIALLVLAALVAGITLGLVLAALIQRSARARGEIAELEAEIEHPRPPPLRVVPDAHRHHCRTPGNRYRN